MATQWHMRGEKQGKNVGVIWGFDQKTRILTVSFAILSVTQLEKDVKQVICKVFGLSGYSPVAEFVLPQSISAMQFVTGGLVSVDRLLNDQRDVTLIFSTVF